MNASYIDESQDSVSLESRRIFLSELIGNSKFLVKYRWYLDIEYPEVTICDTPGNFLIESLSTKQKFHANTLLKKCSLSVLTNERTGGEKRIHVRNYIFMDAQFYAITKNGDVLGLREITGLLSLRVTCFEYRQILKQLKNKNSSWQK